MTEQTILVRAATVGDLERILEIYNHEVLHSTATYDTQPRTLAEQRKWYGVHDEKHPVIVAQSGDGVDGWASLSPWSERAAYARTVEVSVYVAQESRRRGVGRRLLEALVAEALSLGHHALIARISADNEASVRLHAALGFADVGTLREVGVKFGRLLDVAIMERLL
jgi:L-amino acid N-acyltransferase